MSNKKYPRIHRFEILYEAGKHRTVVYATNHKEAIERWAEIYDKYLETRKGSNKTGVLARIIGSRDWKSYKVSGEYIAKYTAEEE